MSRPRPARPIALYRHPLSGHSHRAELFLHLLDLPYETHDIDLLAGEQRRPEFLAMNVFGQVPVIDDDGTVVADSNAILVYLAKRYEPRWLPDEPAGAALVQRWLSVAAGPLASGPARARVALLFRNGESIEQPVAQAHRLFAVMEAALAGRPWLAGDAPTIADLALYTYTAVAPEGNVSLDAYPQMRAWLQRVEALPRFLPMRRSACGLAA